MIMTTTKTKISSKSITFYLAAPLRSYFAYYDVDVIPSKFTRKVKVPKVMREEIFLYIIILFSAYGVCPC